VACKQGEWFTEEQTRFSGSGAMGNLKCEFRDGGVPRIREHALASEGSSLLPTPDTERALLDL